MFNIVNLEICTTKSNRLFFYPVAVMIKGNWSFTINYLPSNQLRRNKISSGGVLHLVPLLLHKHAGIHLGTVTMLSLCIFSLLDVANVALTLYDWPRRLPHPLLRVETDPTVHLVHVLICDGRRRPATFQAHWTAWSNRPYFGGPAGPVIFLLLFSLHVTIQSIA